MAGADDEKVGGTGHAHICQANRYLLPRARRIGNPAPKVRGAPSLTPVASASAPEPDAAAYESAEGRAE